jgi:hypothetical protein
MELLAENLAAAGGTAVALIAILAALHRIECRVSTFLARRIGWRASIYPTAVVGVPVHELSHLLAARVFGHRVVGYSLFEPDPTTGTLGYVRHAYRRRNPWQLAGTFFVGVAPFAAGAAILIAVTATMLPAGARLELLERARALAAAPVEPEQLVALAAFAVRSVDASPWLALQLYLAVAVASHMAPSPRDLAGGLPGALLLVAAVAVAVTVASVAEVPALLAAVVLGPVAAFAAVAAALQIGYAALVALLTGQRTGSGSRAPLATTRGSCRR